MWSYESFVGIFWTACLFLLCPALRDRTNSLVIPAFQGFAAAPFLRNGCAALTIGRRFLIKIAFTGVFYSSASYAGLTKSTSLKLYVSPAIVTISGTPSAKSISLPSEESIPLKVALQPLMSGLFSMKFE